jgi:RNase P subunit RPR2
VTQGQKDGKHPKFRVLCRRCNSYLHTIVSVRWDVEPSLQIVCTKCRNAANSFEEEQ